MNVLQMPMKSEPGREERVEEGAGVAGQAPALAAEKICLRAVRVVAHLEEVLDLVAPSLERARQLRLVLAGASRARRRAC